MTKYEILHEPFVVSRHKEHFVNYLEVMIAPNGTIYYAIPSHQEFLINKAIERRGCNREDLMAACPPAYHFDFLDWLIPESGGYVPVWQNFVYNYPLTDQQIEALKMLKREKLFRGSIPNRSQTK